MGGAGVAELDWLAARGSRLIVSARPHRLAYISSRVQAVQVCVEVEVVTDVAVLLRFRVATGVAVEPLRGGVAVATGQQRSCDGVGFRTGHMAADLDCGHAVAEDAGQVGERVLNRAGSLTRRRRAGCLHHGDIQ